MVLLLLIHLLLHLLLEKHLLLELLLLKLRLSWLGWLPGLARHVLEGSILASLRHLGWKLIVEIKNVVNCALLRLSLSLHLCLHLCLHLGMLGHLCLYHLRVHYLGSLLLGSLCCSLEWLKGVLSRCGEVQEISDKRLSLLLFFLLFWLNYWLRLRF